MAVVSAWVGAPTPDGATFVCKVDGGGPVRVAVADNEAMAGAVFTPSQAVDAQGVAKVSITGLAADTGYWWQVEDNGVLDTSFTGRFHTLPPAGAPASFTIVCIGDSGLDPEFPGVAGTELDNTRVSNHPVYDTIRQQAHANGWRGVVHLGDMHYYNLGDDYPGDLANYRRAYDDVLAQPNAARLFREVALWSYVWDDHDYGPNDSDGTLATKANAAQAYRERVPHPPLATTDAIYHAFQVGRIQFVAFDTRYHRSPNSDPDTPSKVMLGPEQRAWLQSVLEASTASALVMLMSSQWLGVSEDSWASFTHERDAVVEILASTGWAHRAVMVSADAHGIGLISSGGNPNGGWPILHCAAIDATPTGGGPQYDLGYQAGRGQYGTLTVSDLGSAIIFRLAGWQNGTLWREYRFGVSASAPSLGAPSLVRVLSGSHRVVVEARVVEPGQTGPDPDGDPLAVVDGEIRMDGTADVQRTLTLTVAEEQFPRRRGDRLLPDGTEIFVRRGVDTGAQILWVPLGYFVVYDGDQDDAPDGPIRIVGYDRMVRIIDEELLQGVRFDADTTYGQLFDALVSEVYPSAVVVFDDDLGQQPLGRPLDVESSRMEALRTLAHGRGKILHWDGEGFLRVRTAPDPSVPLWEANAGKDGVLSTVQRRITRRDVANVAVVRSQGGDAFAPVRAVAIDDGPTSITRFGGRFGRVPTRVDTPADITLEQAQQAARQTLLRHAGLPYQLTFTAVPNPALQPYDPVRVTLRDGTRERHVLQTLTVPLSAARPMTATTREQRRSRVVVVSA